MLEAFGLAPTAKWWKPGEPLEALGANWSVFARLNPRRIRQFS